MTPLKSIRQFCLRCTNGDRSEVRKCTGVMIGQGDENGMCFFHPYRLGRGRPSVKKIREHCMECWGGSCKFVRECGDGDCPTWPYRMGKNPKRTGIGGLNPPKRSPNRSVRTRFPSKSVSEPSGSPPLMGQEQ